MITLPPTDAMGNSSLFFVLAFLGRRKIGSASALSGFPLEIFLRGRTKQNRAFPLGDNWQGQLLMIMPPPTDAMGDSSLLFVLAYLRR